MALFDLVIAADLTVGEAAGALFLAAMFMALPLLIAAGLTK
jgi:hypothetical protein